MNPLMNTLLVVLMISVIQIFILMLVAWALLLRPLRRQRRKMLLIQGLVSQHPAFQEQQQPSSDVPDMLRASFSAGMAFGRQHPNAPMPDAVVGMQTDTTVSGKCPVCNEVHQH